MLNFSCHLIRAIRRISTDISHKSKMNQDVKPRFSIGFPEEQGLKDLASLQKPSGRWSICANGMGLERGFKFKGFKNAWVSVHGSLSISFPCLLKFFVTCLRGYNRLVLIKGVDTIGIYEYDRS